MHKRKSHVAATIKYSQSHLWERPTLSRKSKDTKFKKRKLCDWPVAHPEVLKGFCGYLVNWRNCCEIKVPEMPPRGEVAEDRGKRAAAVGEGWVGVWVESSLGPDSPVGRLRTEHPGPSSSVHGARWASTIRSPNAWSDSQQSRPSNFLSLVLSTIDQTLGQSALQKRISTTTSPLNMQNLSPLWLVKIC